MKKMFTTPGPAWKALKEEVPEGHSCVMHFGPRGLLLETSDNVDVPKSTQGEPVVLSRAALLEVIRMMTALHQGRPVKLVPKGKASWSVCYGPAAKG